MDATTLIEQHLDVETILNYYGFDMKMTDKVFARGRCEIHKGNNPTAFVINMENGLWFCHTGGCGGGDIFTLVELMENLPFAESVKKVADILGVNIDDMEIKQRKADYIKSIRDFIRFMNGKKKEEYKEFKLPVGKKIIEFRGFQRETIDKFNLFFLEEYHTKTKDDKDYVLKNRLVFPITFRGKTVGMSMRRTKSSDFPKWSHQPPNLYVGGLIYNYDQMIGQDSVVIVEGIPDVWAFDEIGIVAGATYGAHITEEQYRLLLKTGADVVLCFDNDEAGDKAKKKAIKLFKNKTRVFTINLPIGNDPDDLPKEELKEYYANRTRIC